MVPHPVRLPVVATWRCCYCSVVLLLLLLCGCRRTAWISRRTGCKPSSTCTGCTIDPCGPYRTPCGISCSHRASFGSVTPVTGADRCRHCRHCCRHRSSSDWYCTSRVRLHRMHRPHRPTADGRRRYRCWHHCSHHPVTAGCDRAAADGAVAAAGRPAPGSDAGSSATDKDKMPTDGAIVARASAVTSGSPATRCSYDGSAVIRCCVD